MEIVIIGTEPPCIRCHTTYKRAKEVAQQFSEVIEVKKVAIHTQDLRNLVMPKPDTVSARKAILSRMWKEWVS